MNSDLKLTEEQKEKLIKLQEVTSHSDQQICFEILCSSNWDLQTAIANYLDNRNKTNKSVAQNQNQTGGLFGSVLSNLKSLFAQIKRLFYTDRALQVISSTEKFKKEFGENSPNFSGTGFEEAIQRCRRESKLLFVYIHDFSCKGPQNKDAKDFCKNVLCSPCVTEYLDLNYIPWMADINDKGAATIKARVLIKASPFILIAAYSKSVSWTKIFSNQGYLSQENLMNCLFDAQIDFERYLESNMEKSVALIKENVLKKEQDDEYQRALKKDIETLEKQKSLSESDKQYEEKIKNKEKKNMPVTVIKNNLGSEPSQGSKGCIEFVFVLPNGKTKSRRFLEKDTINKLYSFVDSLELKVGERYLGFYYVIVTAFPSQTYQRSEVILSDYGFHERVKVIVRPK